MQYLISHLTEYKYSTPITESVMEVRMMPRSEGHQRCWRFRLMTKPRTNTFSHEDFHGNIVHSFNAPGKHSRLVISGESLVEVQETPDLPDALPNRTWDQLDEMAGAEEFYDFLNPSKFVVVTPALEDLRQELALQRRADPLTVLRELNTAIYDAFEYVPKSTKVDSPIDEALNQRKGVCQDFAHITIALTRSLGIPSRYVSGYLYHGLEDHDRSLDGATHAWVEVYLPELGWIGLDPTNNLFVGIRHIRVAVGRDYADVPPSRGVFKGDSISDLSVSVKITPSKALVFDDDAIDPSFTTPTVEDYQQQQQQQQQQ